MYKFFSDNNLIYPLQFRFRQKYSTVHALISLAENIRKNLDKENIGCGIFVDLQKAFDTIEHDIVLSKLEHYGICGLANEWFKSYLSNRKQYVSINGYDFNLADVKFGVSQESVLGPLLFLVYINDLNQALKFCKVHHKLNSAKTELVIFKHQRKKLDSPIKIKLIRKGLYPSKLVEYLGIKIDENLNWKKQIHDIAIKLNRANALLSIIINYVNKLTLRTIEFAIFHSHVNYADLICGQNLHSLSRIIIL